MSDVRLANKYKLTLIYTAVVTTLILLVQLGRMMGWWS